MKLGFIGLGRMGSGMAANLVRAGHAVTVFNRSPANALPLLTLGARQAGCVADACDGEVVFTMLANDAAVEDVALGGHGIVDSLPAGAIHLSMSTISVALSKRLSKAHADAGQRLVAAPVFGRPDMAAAGKLFIAAAGEPRALSACQPLLAALGQKVFVMGPDPEAANLVKLGGNFLIAAAIEALGEAVALVGKSGVSPRAFVEVLTSTVFDSPVYRTYGGMIAGNTYLPAGFAAELGHKDIRLALAAADDLRVAMPLAGLLHDRFLRLLAHGGAELDWAAIGGLAAHDAGPPAAGLSQWQPQPAIGSTSAPPA
jgi:3-hydroxyisobutyrate dehydrogenase-like beta-hydroxyacid dehydrogenase